MDLKGVNLYKIKPVCGFQDFLQDDLSNFVQTLKVDSKGMGYEVYTRFDAGTPIKRSPKDIGWLSFLNAEVTPKYECNIHQQFPKGVMALRITPIGGSDLYFALVFGSHGISFLKKEKIVYDFGIRVGMNICSINKLQKIQTATHEGITQHTERQVSRATELNVFGINNEKEFLKKAFGASRSQIFRLC